MFISDELLLSKIEAQNAYCDKKSKESVTGVVKRKYKLAGNGLRELGVYTFFVSTTNLSACKKRLTIEVEKNHWENLTEGYFKKDVAYIDVTKIEVLRSGELLEKIKDENNKFPHVGKLCDIKYQELRLLRARAVSDERTHKEKKETIQIALSDAISEDFISESWLENFGLN